jgi:hypothetical protein
VQMAPERSVTVKYLREVPCAYKHSCGYEVCMLDSCPEYIPHNKKNPWYENDPEKYDKEAQNERF